MKFARFLAITCALLPRIALGAPADVPFVNGFPVTERTRLYALEEVKRGDEGVGYTVFSGATPQPFGVEVLGVMRSLVGPGQDVILVRLSGPQIEFTGVISGMSGSPVFIDGRLVGAVAYRFGQFTREPIAGITPIRNMLELYGAKVGPKPKPTGGLGAARLPIAGRRLRVEDYRARAGALPPPLPGRPAVANRPSSGELQPIDTPIAISGLDAPSLDHLREHLAPGGFTVVAGGGSGRQRGFSRHRGARRVEANRADRAGTVDAAPIAPASPVAIVLMRGAMDAAALCTVTMVEREQVYGCGHPFLGVGHVQFPMATAAILNTVASERGAWKQSAAALEVGLIDQDRLTAIAGRLGRAAPMVPVRVVVRRADQPPSEAEVTDVEIVDSPDWLPVMLNSVVASAVNRRLGFEAGGTLNLKARLVIDDRTLLIRDTFTAPPPTPLGSLAASDVATAAGILLRNELGRAPLTSVEVEAVVAPEVSFAQVQSVTPDRAWVRPGEQVGLTVELKPFREPRRQVRLRVPIPSTAVDSVTVVVGGGIELDRKDSDARGGRDPASLSDLIKILGERRPAQAVFARTYLSRPGYRARDTVLTDLPPTLQATLSSNRSQTSAVLKQMPGPEVRRADSDVVVGAVELKLEVRP